MFYLHWAMQPGARGTLPSEHAERAAYVAVRDGQRRRARLFRRAHDRVRAGSDPVIQAATPATVMLLGGELLGPRHVWWNLVSHSMDRIEQAKADWKAGRFALPPQDNQEFIPLPETPPPPSRSAP